MNCTIVPTHPTPDEDIWLKALEEARQWTLSWDSFVKLLFPSSRMNFDAHSVTPLDTFVLMYNQYDVFCMCRLWSWQKALITQRHIWTANAASLVATCQPGPAEEDYVLHAKRLWHLGCARTMPQTHWAAFIFITAAGLCCCFYIFEPIIKEKKLCLFTIFQLLKGFCTSHVATSGHFLHFKNERWHLKCAQVS